jgi:2-desacetyl-2-hydroxyethyl bacteriochlorophyllide A dehydrogenase
VAKEHADKGNRPDRATEAQALWYIGAGQATIQSETLPPLENGHVRIATLFSGISRGTESLIFNGQVPPSEYERMRAPFQGGYYPFPVKYGYASVGRIVDGADSRRDQIVFALHPHQTLFDVPVDAAHVVPANIPPERAVLAANMETALNALWDGGLAPGDHIAVVGAGVLGALTAYLAARVPGTRVTLIDKNPDKAPLASALGVDFSHPENSRGNNDLVIHASASEAGLNTAIGLCGEEATIVEMSWYGAKPVTIGLGGAFHAQRLKLISSQVGQIPPSRRPRWDYARRLSTAISLLDDPRLDALLEDPIAFDDLPQQLPAILKGDSPTLCQTVRYT